MQHRQNALDLSKLSIKIHFAALSRHNLDFYCTQPGIAFSKILHISLSSQWHGHDANRLTTLRDKIGGEVGGKGRGGGVQDKGSKAGVIGHRNGRLCIQKQPEFLLYNLILCNLH